MGVYQIFIELNWEGDIYGAGKPLFKACHMEDCLLQLLLEQTWCQRATEVPRFIWGTRRIQEIRASALLRRLFSTMNLTREKPFTCIYSQHSGFQRQASRSQAVPQGTPKRISFRLVESLLSITKSASHPCKSPRLHLWMEMFTPTVYNTWKQHGTWGGRGQQAHFYVGNSGWQPSGAALQSGIGKRGPGGQRPK